MGRPLTVLHTSDWQCGRPYQPEAGDALVRLAERLEPDVVVVAGDLTQRAKRREFRDALALLDRLPDVPTVVTPGNHDVPLYRFWERLFTPFANWKHVLGPQLDTVTRVDRATFVALCSAAPHRAIVNGRLSGDQLAFAAEAFASAADGDVRCLVVHHHFIPIASGEGGRPLPRAERWLERIEAMGVDLVLGGHVHQTHVRRSSDVLGERRGPGVPVVSCGTTTSRRGRGPEEGWNSLNVVRISKESIEIETHRRGPGERGFAVAESERFVRGGGRGTSPMGVRGAEG